MPTGPPKQVELSKASTHSWTSRTPHTGHLGRTPGPTPQTCQPLPAHRPRLAQLQPSDRPCTSQRPPSYEIFGEPARGPHQGRPASQQKLCVSYPTMRIAPTNSSRSPNSWQPPTSRHPLQLPSGWDGSWLYENRTAASGASSSGTSSAELCLAASPSTLHNQSTKPAPHTNSPCPPGQAPKPSSTASRWQPRPIPTWQSYP